MQANSKINLTKQHVELLEYSDSLFSRWSLRKNSYLFKHMKPNLQIPLFIIAEERRISQITQSQNTIIQALKQSQFVQVNEQARTIKLIELPTLRFQDQQSLIKTENLLKAFIKQKAIQDKANLVKPPEYIISSKTDDGYYYITLKSRSPQDKNVLKQIVQKHNKQKAQKIGYSQITLYEDIKDNVNKTKKMRTNYNNHNSGNYNSNYGYNEQQKVELSNPVYSRQNMMMMYPGMYYSAYPGISPQQMQAYMMQGQQHLQTNKTYGTFIRKAVDSDQQQQPTSKQQQKQKIQKLQTPTQLKQQIKSLSLAQKVGSQVSSPSNNGSPTGKKHETKGAKNKKQTYEKKQKQGGKEEKGKSNKVVIDDNDFPTIG